MTTSESTEKRRKVPWILGITVLLLLAGLVVLQSSNYWRTLFEVTERDTILLYALLSLNFFAFIIFGFIFLRSILKLARERRALQLGAKLKTRLFVYFAAISILPIFAMAFFSYLFMNRALERRFTQVPETVVREAKDLQARSIKERAEQFNNTVRMLAVSLSKQPIENNVLEPIVVAGDIDAALIIGADGRILASAVRAGANIGSDELVRIIGNAGQTSDPNPGADQIESYAATLAGGQTLVIVPTRREGTTISQTIDSSLAEYDSLKQQQITVRQLGLLTLGVLTFLLIFASSWTAFYVARGLTAPIKALAEGADRIAKGELGHRVETLAEDELELLVDAFNQMSGTLEANATELNDRRKYIETVLLSLPTGVISVDSDNRVSTINPAARSMLRLEDRDHSGLLLSELLGDVDLLVFERLISRAKRVGHASEQTKLNIGADSELPVAFTASALPDKNGAVLVIEDLSELISAQRASAWSEVARRMAHEIKNPLTPIQLSAERIAKRIDAETLRRGDAAIPEPSMIGVGIKPLVKTEDQTAKVIQEGTDTILREVQSLKAMVDEFSRFARLPNAKLENGDVNDVLMQVAGLYLDRTDDVLLETNLAESLPAAMIDAEQLKRVFVNLIDNAIEAPGDDDIQKTVVVTSRHDAARDLIVVEISDNGEGIDPADFQKLFQPYFSTKGRGTGLGLAIVQRIITEHQGKIKAVSNQPRGAKFIVELPTST